MIIYCCLRYGYRTLPNHVDQALFEERLRSAAAADRDIASRWYMLTVIVTAVSEPSNTHSA